LTYLSSLTQTLSPNLFNQPRDDTKCAESLVTLKASLNIIESYFLKDRKFIGGDEISIADLEFLGEITQYWAADCNIYKGRPNMERWMEDCQKQLAPFFDSVHDVIYDLRASGTCHYPIDTMN
jgi:glutathione S-transferase